VETVEIARRFRGPSSSGNGGYTCGLLSRLVEGDAEVTLRAPPPLDTPLRVVGLQVFDGETLVAEVRPTTVELELPEPVSFADARALEPPPDPDHPFPECFVCGPQATGSACVPAPSATAASSPRGSPTRSRTSSSGLRSTARAPSR
jgi:hypothetical protein